jgi:hypothetical protein
MATSSPANILSQLGAVLSQAGAAQQGPLIVDQFNIGLVDEEVLSKYQYSPQACVDCQDVELFPRGTISRRKGFDRLHLSTWHNTPITKIFQWQSTVGVDFAIAFCPTSGSTSADIASVETTGSFASFTSILTNSPASSTWSPGMNDIISTTAYAGSAVFVYDNTLVPHAWNGKANAVVQPLSGSAPSGAKYCASYGNHLLLANVLDSTGSRRGSRVVWCYPGDPHVWPATYYLDFDADDGDEITNISSVGNLVVVQKTYKTFVMHYTGDSDIFKGERISMNIGCVAHNSAKEHRGILYFLSVEGFYKFDGASAPVELSMNIRTHFNQLNNTYRSLSQTIVYPDKDQVWVSVPFGSSTTLNRIYILDFSQTAWTKFNISCSSLEVIRYGANLAYENFPSDYGNYDLKIGDAYGSKSEIIVMGSSNGFINRYGLFNTDNGTPITAFWTSCWLDFGMPNYNKRIVRGTLWLEKEGNYNLSVLVFADWDDITPVNTFSVSLSSTVPTIEKRLDFTRNLRSFRFTVTTSGEATSGSPFRIHKIAWDYVPKGRTKVS